MGIYVPLAAAPDNRRFSVYYTIVYYTTKRFHSDAEFSIMLLTCK